MKFTFSAVLASALLAAQSASVQAQCYDGCPPKGVTVGQPLQCWFCETRDDCVKSGGCDANDESCCCVAWTVNYCGTPTCNEFTRCADETPSKVYYMIKGIARKSKTEWCWEVRNGSGAEGNKIILNSYANCNFGNAQLFELNAFTTPEGVDSVSIAPFVNQQYLVGVREDPDDPNFDQRAWLRIEPPELLLDGTQHFIRDEDTGFVYTDAAENFIVTNQGANPDVGDPIMLKLESLATAGDHINEWILVPNDN